MTRVWITRARNADGTEAAALYDLYLDGEPAAHGKTSRRSPTSSRTATRRWRREHGHLDHRDYMHDAGHSGGAQSEGR